MGIAHLALDLGPGGEGRHRVDDDHVEGPGADEHVGDLEGLLPCVGLGDQEFVDVNADGPGVDGVHGVLGVDVGADAAIALRLGHDVGGESGLARPLGAEDLDHPPPGQTTDTERQVQCQRPGGYGLDGQRGLGAHLHDGAGAELLLYLGQRQVEGLAPTLSVDVCDRGCAGVLANLAHRCAPFLCSGTCPVLLAYWICLIDWG